MRRANRIVAVCVTAAMAFQMLAPAPGALAQESAAFASVPSAASQYADGASNASLDIGESDVEAPADNPKSDATGSGEGSSEDAQGTADSSDTEGSSENATDAGAAADANASNGNDSEGEVADEETASEGRDAERANGAYRITSVEDLQKALGKDNVDLDSNGKGTIKLNVKNENLLALSDTDPRLYQHASITRNTGTGDSFDVTAQVKDCPYEFKGFGNDEYPFEGTFDLGNEKITLNKSLFNNVKLSADCTVNLIWKGTGSQAIVAKKIDGGSRNLMANVTAGKVNANDTTATLASPLLGDVDGSLTLNANYAADQALPLAVNINASAGNIGLLASTVNAEGSLHIKNVGGLPQSYSGNPTIRTAGGNAGGLIGECGDKATVKVGTSVDLSKFTVVGLNASGGFIGKAANLTLDIDADVVVKPARTVGDAGSSFSGGIIGDVRFARGYTVPSSFVFDDVVTLGARYRAGCLFGKTDISNGDIVVQGGTYKSQLTSGNDGNQSTDSSRGSYGGLVGNVFATSKGENGALRALIVEKASNGDNAVVEFSHASALCYAGGIVGYVGDKTVSKDQLQPVAVVLDGVSVTCKGDASATQSNGRYGGAVGVVDMNDVLDVRNFVLSSDSAIGGASQNRSAGIAGSAWIATIKFSGVTDLSGARFAENATTGQLVNENYNSLIFASGSGGNGNIANDGAASGWTLNRSNTESKTDDLATYGEVLRLWGGGLSDSLLQLDFNSHILKKSESVAWSDNACTLASKEDFAKLAITWQTNGYYSMVQGVNHSADDAGNGLGSLTSSTINVTSEIDLSGTGLTGLTKDRVAPAAKWEGGVESSQLFSGALMGSGTINLAVGESYGMRGGQELNSSNASHGDGKIYRHGRLGLFNAISAPAGGSVAVNGVTVGGTMRFENGADIDAGSLAAQVAGTGSVTVSNATFSTAITFDSAATGKVLNVGGIFGSVADACTLTLGSGANAKATLKNSSNASDIRVGELAGYVAGDKAAIINVSGLEVGADSQKNDIEIGDSSTSKALVGGLIGFIQQGSVKKAVNITGLSYENFAMSVGANGDAKKGAGGLLGYSWGNAIVTIGGDMGNDDGPYALKTDNASVTANNASEFGGLLYVMSGHFVIQGRALDLSGASLSATKATCFGVLLARGAKEEKAGTFGGEGTNKYTGLYLEDKTPWSEAYRVKDGSNGLQISANQDVKYFDEWIANVTKGSEKSQGTPNDNDWNAIISLSTGSTMLDMSGEVNANNSYKNRTGFGESHPTNSMARYYYNLDRCWEAASSVFEGSTYNLTTPQALMIWNVCCYAPDEIRAYIAPSKKKFTRETPVVIGSADGSSNAIDLTGYSYYPTNNTCKITIQNTTITFAYSKIKAEQINNKSNASATQHANMHASLIRAFAGDADKSLNVTGVTLAGSTGIMVNDNSSSSGTSVSGALVCRSAYGSTGKTTSVTTISIDGLTLNGLVVDGANGTDGKGNPKIAPLLINDLSAVVTLNVKNLSVQANSYTNGSKTTTAASSLFGNLGGSKATNTLVNAALSNVSVPSEKGKTIFTRASFFESFGYGANQSGSASYNFNKADSKVTYGAEIDSNGEYHDKQLWYYDATKYGQSDSPDFVSDGDIAAEASIYGKYGKYLPYVKVGKSGTCYHEMKVNQRVANLVAGCGTYSDPYTVSTASELYTLTDYINDQNSVVDEWKVTITANQGTSCARRQPGGDASVEVTYQYSDKTGKWVRVEGASTASSELDNDVMHRYLQSAYYSIEPADENNEIVVDASSFSGFGSLTNPFRGVIVGNLKGESISTINIKLADDGSSNKTASFGLIPYSYGSVVRELNVTYSGGTNRVAYASKETNSGTPGAFFGGVIGCIMGGDNIIDGVSVSGGTVESSGDKAHLVPTGGYVGAICGGGVIFRNMGNSNNWRSATKDTGSLYNNPYVGRVVDGYAFSEGCDVDNGDANYKIVQLSDFDAGHITTSGTEMAYSWPVAGKQHDGAATVQVNSAKGLLILSAIINSGAAAGAAHSYEANDNGTYRGSRAYEGCSFKSDVLNGKKYLFGNEQFGKVRNATYASVGTTGSNDATIAKCDDEKAPGNQNYQGPLDGTDEQAKSGDVNSPYLVQKYANWATGYVCATGITGIQLKLTGDSYDMTDFGTAYQGLSGRYYSNACITSNGVNERKYITPAVACIDGTTASGGSASITVTNNYKEYTDDDYRASGVGALFNSIAFTSADYVASSIASNDGAQVRNLTFSNCNLSLGFINKDGDIQTKQDSDTAQMGVGCLAGVTSNLNKQDSQGVYKNVVIDGCTVTGGANAGGIIGSVGYMGLASDKSSRMVASVNGNADAAQAPAKLIDCLYKNSTISAEANAGGFVGKLQRTTFSVDVNETNQSDAKRVSDEGINLVGKNSTVRSTSVWAANNEACTVGGLLGLTAAEVKIGEGTNAEKPIALRDVTVTTDAADDSGFANTRGLGGVVGRTENAASIKHVSFESSKSANAESPTYVGSIKATGQTNVRYKYVGGMVGYGSEDLTFDDCGVSNVRIAAYECSGGMAGMIASGKTFSASGIQVNAIQVDGAYSGGILGQSGENGSTTVVVKNSSVSNSVFKTKACWWTDHPDGRHTYSGGIIGDTKGTINMANILVSKNNYEERDKSKSGQFCQGQLFGDVAAGDIAGIYVAGVSVRINDGQTSNDVPGIMHYRDGSQVGAVNKKTYIAFADYSGALGTVDGSGLYNDDDAARAVDSAYPYVTTNPESSLSVRVDNSQKYLFSDGAASCVKEGVQYNLAREIKADATASTPPTGKYVYNNIGGINKDTGAYQNDASYDPAKADSTFNSNNTDAGHRTGQDFPVLLISGNDASATVKSYLNVVTNGGFSDALLLNTGDVNTAHVTAKAEMFELDDNGNFVKATKDDPTLSVVGNGMTGMTFQASSDWDNDKGRFTLLTVTFHEAGTTYKVQVPIVVKRMLEIDFAATYSEGTNFNSADYGSKFNTHVLISSGDAMTGYLTWTYNQAFGVQTEYGWNTLLASGGSMKPLNKTIEFGGDKGALPAHTQLTLIDTAHNNKEYHYTVGEHGATSVKLTDFYDSSNMPYEEQWLSEMFGVAASKDSSGTWVKLGENDDKSQAGAKVIVGDNQGYYRQKTARDTAGDFYTLAVSEETSKSENFYLIVRTPAGSASVNGYTGTSISTDLNKRINYVRYIPREDGGVEIGQDDHQITASTYSIASNYDQSLNDNLNIGVSPASSNGGMYSLQMNVSDTVSFGEQEFNDTDELYFQLNSSLVNYSRDKDGNVAVVGAQGYPTGVHGKYLFYVKAGDNYYVWDASSGKGESSWRDMGETEPELSDENGRSWSATGADMSLVFADAEGNAIDLSGWRKKAVQTTDGKKAFTIGMKADLTMSAAACEQGIVSSQNGDQYTKPSYRASLSTHAATLSTSNNTKYIQGNRGYYRVGSGASSISFEASKKSQLGINVDDLSLADGTIGAIGSYDLKKLHGADSIIAKADKVKYMLSLQKRTGTNEDGSGKYENVSIGEYVKEASAGVGNALGMREGKGQDSFTWEDEKDSNGNFKTLTGDALFQLPVTVQVDVTKDTHTYANYRLVLAAQLYSGDTLLDAPSNTSDYITYTLTRVNLRGIQTQQNSN